MKKIIKLSEYDIKKIIAEKFDVDSSNIYIKVSPGGPMNEDPEVRIEIEMEFQNYDL